MRTITPPTHRPLRLHELVTAFRLLAVSGPRLDAALPIAAPMTVPVSDRAEVELTSPFVPLPGRTPRWRARARIRPGGPRLVPYARVEVEVAPRAGTAAELRIHPVSRHVHAWGARRLRRYLRLLPHVADAIADHLATAAAATATIDLRSTAALLAVPAPDAWAEPATVAGDQEGCPAA